MNELAEFFVKFTTVGLVEVQKGIDDITDKVDELSDSFNKGEKKGDSFFSKLSGWTLKVTGLIGSFKLLSSVVRGVFDVNEDVMSIYNASDATGARPKDIEKFGLLSKYFNGTGVSSAEGFFNNLTNILVELKDAKYRENWIEQMNRAGFMVQWNDNYSLQQNQDMFIRTLAETMPNLSIERRNKVAEAFGLSDDIKQLLSSGHFDELMRYADSQRIITSKDEALHNAVALKNSIVELKTQVNRLILAITPLITAVVNKLVPLLEKIDEKWIERQVNRIIEFFRFLFQYVGRIINNVAEGDSIYKAIKHARPIWDNYWHEGEPPKEKSKWEKFKDWWGMPADNLGQALNLAIPENSTGMLPLGAMPTVQNNNTNNNTLKLSLINDTSKPSGEISAINGLTSASGALSIASIGTSSL